MPDQPPLAVQDTALALDQLSVAVPPGATAAGLADKVTAGAAGEILGAVGAIVPSCEPQPEKVDTAATSSAEYSLAR